MHVGLRRTWHLIKEAGEEWYSDNAPRLGAALSYYTVFSIAPLLLIVIGIVGSVFGAAAAQGSIVGEIRALIGDQGADAINTMIVHARAPEASRIATISGTALLVIGALSVFIELQDALNEMWGVQPKPGRNVRTFVKARLLSFGLVVAIGFLLLVSLIVSAALGAAGRLLGDWQLTLFGRGVSFAISLAVLTVLFAMIYRFLPDVKISWGEVWLGGALTALLFSIGKILIGFYLGHSRIASMYGAAGSFAVLLIWTYYSAMIFYFGAELTKVYANRFGRRIVPSEHAVAVSRRVVIEPNPRCGGGDGGGSNGRNPQQAASPSDQPHS